MSQISLVASETNRPAGTKICPTCEGKGFCDESVSEPSQEMDEVKSAIGRTALPKMLGQKSAKYIKQTWRLSDMSLPILPTKPDVSQPKCGTKSVPNCLNKMERPLLKRNSSLLSKISNDSQKDYSIEKKEIKHINEFVRITKLKLKSEDIEDIATGVINTVHIARQVSDLAITLMPQVNRNICALLKSLKHHYVYIAFETIKELYQLVPLISRPEFDEMVQLLLGKVTDLKSSIRDAANEALDVVAANTPPQYIVRAVMGKGPRSKNASSRETSARLLNHVIDSIGPSILINAYNLRDIRKNITECALFFLEDRNGSVRNIGKQMVAKLIEVPEFEDIVLSDVPQTLYKRVEKILINIKYEKRKIMFNK